jgi:DNA-binding MarR family transcriptional regulator
MRRYHKLYLTIVRARTIFSSMGNKSPRHFVNQLARIREAANLLIEKELQVHGLKGIVPAHGLVFAFLLRQNGPVPIKALVQQSGRVKSAVTGMVNTLEKHGYVYKIECVEDARSTLIGLTEKGRAIRQDFEEISAVLEKRVFGDMPMDDRRHLVELLAKIDENLKR